VASFIVQAILFEMLVASRWLRPGTQAVAASSSGLQTRAPKSPMRPLTLVSGINDLVARGCSGKPLSRVGADTWFPWAHVGFHKCHRGTSGLLTAAAKGIIVRPT
jgi:hypothetical protein